MIHIACAACIVAFGTELGAGGESTILLHGFESGAGVQLTWQSPKAARIEVNHDRRFLSAGQASLHLSARSAPRGKGNQYFGMLIPLAKADCRQRLISLDCWSSTPAAITTLYVRLWAGKQRTGSWRDSSAPFEDSARRRVDLDAGLATGRFAWEEKDTDPSRLDQVTAIEIIIGTDQLDAPLDLFVDQLRVGVQRRIPFAEVTRAKPLFRETPLVRASRAQAILVAPAGTPFDQLAERIQAAVRQATGAELPLLRPEAATPDRLANTQAVLLGNVCNNRALQPLYGLLYTPVDEAYPPADGYLVHTVHDPWGTGHNALVVGGSTPAGLTRAVETLLSVIRPGADLVLPKLALGDLGPKDLKQNDVDRRRSTDKVVAAELERARADFLRGAHRGVASRMGEMGFRYARNGVDGLARLYRDLAFAWYESYLAKPPIYGGPWGMDMDFHLMEILPAWDLLEESPVLSDEDRLRVTRILFEFVTTDVVRKAAGSLRSNHVRHNHITFPALGLYYAGRYFKHGYNCPEADHWLRIAEACFALQARTAKPHEDCNGYGWLVPYHTMRYSLATLDARYFTSGSVGRLCDYAILTMDNLGYQVPYGDTGTYQCWWTEIPFLRGAAYYLRDGRCAWALEKKLAVRPDDSRFQYTAQIAPREPKELFGARAWPVDEPYWESMPKAENVKRENTFDKLAMRASFDPDRQYLLLDGLSNGGHMHFDGNSISRITDRGRIWLADNDYIRSLPKFHNSMLVFRDGRTDTIPPYAELGLLADGHDYAASRTSVRAYAGADWHRNILWNKEQFFLVVDEVEAREPGDYDLHCMWHTVGHTQLGPEGLEVEQQGPRFWIKPAAGPRLSLTEDRGLGRNWVGYAYADPMVYSLREVQSARLATGQRVRFANLLFARDERRPQQFSIDRLGPETFLVRSGTSRMVAGVGRAQPVQIAQGLSITAELFLVGAQSGFAAGTRRLACGAYSLESPAPIDVEWTGRQLQLRAPRSVEVRLRGGEQESAVSVGTQPTLVDLPDDLPLSSIAAALDRLQPTKADHSTEPAIPATGKLRWKFQPPAAPVVNTKQAKSKPSQSVPDRVTAHAAADLDNDGRDEIICGSEQGHIWCLDADGRVRWQAAAQGRVTTAAAACLDRSGQRFALLGSEDCKVYAFAPDGKFKWTYELPMYKDRGRVRVLLAADLDADGIDEVIAGADNWRYYAVDAQGRERWHYESVHPASAGAAVDLDGDGRRELLCGTVYYWWHCAACDGTKRWSYSVKGPHATAALAVNFTGGKTRTPVFGSEDGNLHVLGPDGKLKWMANVGDQVTSALAVDLTGSGREQLVASSLSFNVFALDGDGKVLWRRNLGSPVECLAIHHDGKSHLAAGCQDGSLVFLDGQGNAQGRYQADSAVLSATPARVAGQPQIVVRLADGRLIAIGP
jgi:outer membrane protein assembly factor BamB